MRRCPAPALLGLLTFLCAGCGDSPQEPGNQGPAVIPAQNGATAHVGGANGGITVPSTGSSDDGRTFRGTLVITGAGFDPQLGPVLLVRIRGALVPGSGGSSGNATPSESADLEYGPIPMDYDSQADMDEDCIELELRPPPLFNPETKTTVQFDVSRVTTHTIPGPANLIADLICANDRLVEYRSQSQESPQ